MAKGAVLCCTLLAFCFQALNAEKRQPSVQVFTRYPVENGKQNTLQCYVSGFHPPKISITLLNGKEPMESQQSDLSFDQSWAFHRLVFANVTINTNAEYACKVDHETFKEPGIYKLDMDH